MIKVILEELISDIVIFFRNWYFNTSKKFWTGTLNQFYDFEKTLALRINLHYWLVPLYQDYSIVGYLIGVPFRTFRIFLALIFYLIYFSIALIIWLIWVSIPILIIFKIFYEILS